MPYNIDPKQQAVRDEVKVFAEKYMYPVSEELDRMPEPRKFPLDLYRKIGEAGFIGYVMPKEYGGQGKSNLEYITLVEEMCYHDPAIALLCAVAELATHPIIHFASEEHKKLFTEKPEKYTPQCGGFCAYGVGLGKLFPVDISTWQVRDGKLYLNLNADILKKFNADFAGNVAKADKHWPELVKKHGK